MKNILFQIWSFKNINGCMPHSTERDDFGRPLSSWRLAMQEWISAGSSPQALKCEPWHNLRNLQLLVATYGGHFVFTSRQECADLFRSNIALIVGPHTALGEMPDVATQASKIPDDTIILIECSTLDCVWSQPGDLDIRQIAPSIVHGVDGNGVHVGFADGEVWYIEQRVPFETLKQFFTVEFGSSRDRQRDLAPYVLE